jgi:hypothetical protein
MATDQNFDCGKIENDARNNIFHARMFLMLRDGAIIFADLIGKLDMPYKSGPSRA